MASSSIWNTSMIDDDGESLRAMLDGLSTTTMLDSSAAAPMQSSAEGLFASPMRLLDTNNNNTLSTSAEMQLVPPPPLMIPPPMPDERSSSMAAPGVFFHTALPPPSSSSSTAVGSTAAVLQLPRLADPSPHISLHASPPRVPLATGDAAAAVLDALELDAGALETSCAQLFARYAVERAACFGDARLAVSAALTALGRAFGLRRRVVLAELLPRWQRLAERLQSALARLRLLGDASVAADGVTTRAGVVGALVIEEQSALPCAAMSKRQRPEGSVTVRWVCSPIALAAAADARLAAPRPRHVRVTIDVADEVARDSFVHNVLAGEPHKQFFKDSLLPLGANDTVTFPLSFVNGTTGHVVCAQFEADVEFAGAQHVVRSTRTRPMALATHTRQWASSSTALLLSCLLQQDEFVDAAAADESDESVKDIRLDVPTTPETGAEADDELSSESAVPSPRGARGRRARDDGPVRRTIVGNRKRASSDAGSKRAASGGLGGDGGGGGGGGGGGTAAAAALLAHAAGTLERQRQPISAAYFGNVLAEHFERHARIHEHESTLKASALSTVRVGLASSDVSYLLGRLRVFASALEPHARLLERALSRFSEWFGAVLTMVRFQRPVAPLLAKGVVFGFMSRATAERAVQGQPRGTCVLRFAERHNAHFAIAYVGGGGGDDELRVRHYLLTDADMVKGVAEFVMRKPHFSHILRFGGVESASGSVRLHVLEKRAAMQFVAEPGAGDEPARPVFEGYESLD